jgi:hypothetical protein
MVFSGKEDVAGSFGKNGSSPKFNLPDEVKKIVPQLSPDNKRKERKEPLIEEQR